ncbi:MAG: general secretion pathway protein GspK [Planctomycetes bacterium]|nr:general secretion pathway protein GspK [Planctomycetota bacterium]
MCGIVAYLGKKPAQPILVEGLKRLEYRGYDSSGVAFLDNGSIRVQKSVGRISALEAILNEPEPEQTLGIGHTRWATHGEPNTTNAHPHLDYSGKIVVVHNGIVENYTTLKKWLESEGVSFVSDTDTEVAANLIGYFYGKTCGGADHKPSDGQHEFEWAVQQAIQELQGTYGFAILCSDFPDVLIGAKKGSPLILGLGSDEYILASDAAAIVEHTTQAIYLADNEMVIITPDGFQTKTINNVTISKDLEQIEFSLEQIELGGFEHHMLKEIFEQPSALRTCMQGRLDLQNNKIVLGGIAAHLRELTRTKKFIFTACGTDRLNINTVSPAILNALGGLDDPPAAQLLLSHRAGPDGVPGTEDDVIFTRPEDITIQGLTETQLSILQDASKFCFTSDYFRIHASASSDRSASCTLMATVRMTEEGPSIICLERLQ